MGIEEYEELEYEEQAAPDPVAEAKMMLARDRAVRETAAEAAINAALATYHCRLVARMVVEGERVVSQVVVMAGEG